jgi:hypothetical protein
MPDAIPIPQFRSLEGLLAANSSTREKWRGKSFALALASGGIGAACAILTVVLRAFDPYLPWLIWLPAFALSVLCAFVSEFAAAAFLEHLRSGRELEAVLLQWLVERAWLRQNHFCPEIALGSEFEYSAARESHAHFVHGLKDRKRELLAVRGISYALVIFLGLSAIAALVGTSAMAVIRPHLADFLLASFGATIAVIPFVRLPGRMIAMVEKRLASPPVAQDEFALQQRFCNQLSHDELYQLLSELMKRRREG